MTHQNMPPGARGPGGPAPPGPYPPGGPPPGLYPHPVRSGMPGWAIALIVVGIVVVVLAVFGLVAVSSFKKYMRRSRTTEAPPNLKKIFDGAKGYFEKGAVVDRTGRRVSHAFPDSVGLTPSKPCCQQAGKRCQNTDWRDPTWAAVGFEIADPHYFQYRFASSGSDQAARFTAGAHADLDCDGTLSTYERTATVDSQLRVLGAARIYIKNDLE